jgi:cytochrome c oxidase subunit 2
VKRIGDTTDCLRLAVLAVLVAMAGCTGDPATHPMDTMAPESDLAASIRHLFYEITVWDALILAIVVVAFGLAFFFFSTRVGEAAPAQTAGAGLGLEAAFVIGPALVLLMITIPTVRIIFQTQKLEAPKDALEVRVIGHQWWWEFQYPATSINTANEVHIPVGRAVRFLLNADDVIHSFWIPRLGGKRDCIPGHVNQLTLIANTPGDYYGECAEFCGTSHANMRFHVVVDTPAGFGAWLDDQRSVPLVASAAASGSQDGIRAGEQIFANAPCTSCHTISGVSAGHIAPNLTHFGGRHTLAGLRPNNPQTLAEWIRNPQSIKPGALMPPLHLDHQQLADLSAYLESLK